MPYYFVCLPAFIILVQCFAAHYFIFSNIRGWWFSKILFKLAFLSHCTINCFIKMLEFWGDAPRSSWSAVPGQQPSVQAGQLCARCLCGHWRFSFVLSFRVVSLTHYWVIYTIRYYSAMRKDKNPVKVCLHSCSSPVAAGHCVASIQVLHVIPRYVEDCQLFPRQS